MHWRSPWKAWSSELVLFLTEPVTAATNLPSVRPVRRLIPGSAQDKPLSDGPVPFIADGFYRNGFQGKGHYITD
ncbi:MAG TPA: hypothetical protein ENO20_04940 [Bacteroides sp.]|nr:hypothetical protein [Bacteroides sp.]